MIDAGRYDQESALSKRLYEMDPRSQMVCILFLPLFMLISSGGVASDLPEGKGKDVVADTCSSATRSAASRPSDWMRKVGKTFSVK